MVRMPQVLVVDDDPEFLEMVEERLARDKRFEVFAVGSASDAVAALEEKSVDCVVTDSLVLDSGKPLVREVRERDSDIPLIYYTGKEWDEVATSAVGASVSDYIQKGTGSLSEVARRIDVLVGSDTDAALEIAGPANGGLSGQFTGSPLDTPGDEWEIIGVFEPRWDVELDVIVAEAIADYLDRGTDSFSLYESVDADALGTLVLPRTDGSERRAVTVRFPAAGHLVAVTGTGEIAIRDRPLDG